MDPVKYLEKQSGWFVISVGSMLLLIVGTLDFLTGYDLAFSLFYVIPICLLTWFQGRWTGIVTSFASAIVWFAVDKAAGHQYPYIFVPLWNATIRLSFFVIISTLLLMLKSSLERERELARVDYLTGIVNARFFYELLPKEMDRLRRYQRPLTLAYVDLDNMKNANDQYGHATGDQILRTVAGLLKVHTRSTDVVARLGGDEFVLLLPDLNERLARVVFSRIQRALRKEMLLKNWPITFSAGVLTCTAPPESAAEFVAMADALMYSVKRENKNDVKYLTYDGQESIPQQIIVQQLS